MGSAIGRSAAGPWAMALGRAGGRGTAGSLAMSTSVVRSHLPLLEGLQRVVQGLDPLVEVVPGGDGG